MVMIYLIPNAANAQLRPTVEWDKTIGGDASDTQTKVFPLGSGYIVFGTSISKPSGEKTNGPKGGYDIWVVRLDASRNGIKNTEPPLMTECMT